MAHTKKATAHDDAVLSLCWLSATRLVTGGVDGCIKVWAVADGGADAKFVFEIPSAHLLGVTSLSAQTGGNRAAGRGRARARFLRRRPAARLRSPGP